MTRMGRLVALIVVMSPAVLAAPKIHLCHRSGNGYRLIEINANAEDAHRAHGDAGIYEAVPEQPGMIFGPGCEVCPHPDW